MRVKRWSFVVLMLIGISCMEEPDEIPEVCLDQIGYHWTVNGVFQEIPGGEDPFTGGNPNILYSVRTQGDWSVIFNSEDYFINFNQMHRVIGPAELIGLSDEAFRDAIETRGRGDLRDILRVDFNLALDGDSTIWLDKEHLVEGLYFLEVETSPEENCCFLNLYIQAKYEHHTDNYELDFMLKNPYHCQKRF